LSGEALSTASNRFAALQQLIDAIPGASDPKAVMDLQARALGELGMLANENTKLQTVFESLRAQETAQRQRRREQAIADTGSLRTLTPLVFRTAVTAP
jgi:type IV secretion system protein VirB5